MTVQEQRKNIKIPAQTNLYTRNIFLLVIRCLPLLYRRDKPEARRENKLSFFAKWILKFYSTMRLLITWSLIFFAVSKISPMWGKIFFLFNLFAFETKFVASCSPDERRMKWKCSPRRKVKTCHFLECAFLLVDKDFSFSSFVLSN